jgi:hypothetical protein
MPRREAAEQHMRCLLRYLSRQKRCCRATLSRIIITPASAAAKRPGGAQFQSQLSCTQLCTAEMVKESCRHVPVGGLQQRQKDQQRCPLLQSALAAASQKLPGWQGLHGALQGRGPLPEGLRREAPCLLLPQLHMTALLPSWPANTRRMSHAECCKE